MASWASRIPDFKDVFAANYAFYWGLTVSYTHRDVYKRQTCCRYFICNLSATGICNAPTICKLAQQKDEETPSFFIAGKCDKKISTGQSKRHSDRHCRVDGIDGYREAQLDSEDRLCGVDR